MGLPRSRISPGARTIIPGLFGQAGRGGGDCVCGGEGGVGHGFLCRVFCKEKYPSLSLSSLLLPRVLCFSLLSHTSYMHNLLRSPPPVILFDIVDGSRRSCTHALASQVTITRRCAPPHHTHTHTHTHTQRYPTLSFSACLSTRRRRSRSRYEEEEDYLRDKLA